MTTLFISHSSKDKAWAGRTHEALSDGGYQCLFLDSHPDDGIHAGADWEQTLYQRLRQSRGVVVLCSANWLASPWCVAEAMMARDRGKRVFLLATADIADDHQIKGAGSITAPRIPDFLKDAQFVSLGDVTEDEVFRRLLHGLEKEGLKKEDFPLPARPYPGMEPFQETDAAIYFGRDSEIDQVIGVLNRRRRNNAHGFILVLGASGCGKSSLVRAGVLPRLRRAHGHDGGRSAWVLVPPVMGGKGLDGLALSLASAFRDAGQPRGFAAVRGRLGLACDVQRLGYELLNAQGAADGAVLLVLDQLEEVFCTPDGSDACAMLRLLLDATADVASSVVVLATMRSDFLNAFQLFQGTAERYEEVTLDPMPRSRFAEAIEGPADRFGLDLDPGLAERMAEETAYNDALPLLAFTLEKLYETCKAERRLTLNAYDALGGVVASVKHVADNNLKQTGYKDLPADDQRMRDLRRAFYRLAQVGEKGQFTRRVARWSQLPDASKPLLERFVDQRLLVSDTANGERILSVAHEALFRVWDTLNGWLREDRKALALREQIEDAAAEWQAAKRAESRMWAEERILDAVRKIARSGVSLNDVTHADTVRAFLGPTDPAEIARLPALTVEEDRTAGSARYGEAWRLPLGHRARASAGVRLALLGDPRPGIGLRADGLPDIAWRRIEGGEVTIAIRSDPNDFDSEVDRTLKCDVKPFWMARYPVTIAQFQAFLAKCYRDGKWRLVNLPTDFPTDFPPPKHRARYGNHAADSVSWYDAAAFCLWLGPCLEAEIRLPTEYEWQLAATGGDPAQTYPWGPKWDPQQEPWRANTSESGLNQSTAVGLYPLGASPRDILDMAGTLWEWCQNDFDHPDDTGFPCTQSRLRVLRGGSWHKPQRSARCVVRYGDYPRYRDGDVGFRVVKQ